MNNVLPEDYADRVYAGVLGKVIGVYLGRPFEGWTYERIQKQLGDIEYYVHDKLNLPLIVSDDDISGTFTFIRSLADHNSNPDITAVDIGNSWLNYILKIARFSGGEEWATLPNIPRFSASKTASNRH